MPVNGLIDTGALLALLDKSDPWHKACVEAYRKLRLPLTTSEAVFTELFHLIGENARDVSAAWTFLCSGPIVLSTIDNSELPAIRELMSRYADRPMDFADATLVHLAAREGLSTIFTVDHSDFETYRIDGRRRFRIVPVRRPV